MKGIYKITNPYGDIYIGKSKDIEKRWQLYRALNCKGQPLLYNSLSIHGVNNHKFEIQEIITGNAIDLSTAEIKWYSYYEKFSLMLNTITPSFQKVEKYDMEYADWHHKMLEKSILIKDILCNLYEKDRHKFAVILHSLIQTKDITVSLSGNSLRIDTLLWYWFLNL